MTITTMILMITVQRKEHSKLAADRRFKKAIEEGKRKEESSEEDEDSDIDKEIEEDEESEEDQEMPNKRARLGRQAKKIESITYSMGKENIREEYKVIL
jgi:hypothetical protein